MAKLCKYTNVHVLSIKVMNIDMRIVNTTVIWNAKVLFGEKVWKSIIHTKIETNNKNAIKNKNESRTSANI